MQISIPYIIYIIPLRLMHTLHHTGYGTCLSKAKDPITGKYSWNIKGHKDRIVRFRNEDLKVLAKTFEDSEKLGNNKAGFRSCKRYY